MIDPVRFFRINRKFLVAFDAIQEGSTDNDIIVSRERVQAFRDWLDR